MLQFNITGWSPKECEIRLDWIIPYENYTTDDINFRKDKNGVEIGRDGCDADKLNEMKHCFEFEPDGETLLNVNCKNRKYAVCQMPLPMEPTEKTPKPLPIEPTKKTAAAPITYVTARDP